MAQTLTQNFFAVGTEIIAELKEITSPVDLSTRVFYCPSVQTIGKLLVKGAPAVFVIPGRFTPTNQKQQWIIALYERDVTAITEGDGVINSAGELVSAIMNKLNFFVPIDEAGPLKLPSEEHQYPDVGEGIFLMTFEITLEPDFYRGYS